MHGGAVDWVLAYSVTEWDRHICLLSSHLLALFVVRLLFVCLFVCLFVVWEFVSLLLVRVLFVLCKSFSSSFPCYGLLLSLLSLSVCSDLSLFRPSSLERYTVSTWIHKSNLLTSQNTPSLIQLPTQRLIESITRTRFFHNTIHTAKRIDNLYIKHT